MRATKMNHPNEGVKCVVNTCYYYMQGDYCAADKIKVEPRNASDSRETDCATFEPEIR